MTATRRLALVLGALALAWLLLRASGLGTHFTLPELRALFERHLALAGLLFTLLFMAGNLLQIPGWVFLAAAVLALGPRWGGLLTYWAACISCLSTFGLMRALGGDALRQWHRNKLGQGLFARLDQHPLQSVTALRLLFQTVPALNVALALSGVPWRAYFWGTLLGLPLPIFLYTVFFEQLVRWLPISR